MNRTDLIYFWEECGRDPKKRVYFYKVFGDYLKSLPERPQEPPERTKQSNWTDNQRRAFHKGCEELADYLNAHGKDMKAVLRDDVDIPWSKDSVKEFIFRPIMKAMYGYDSHTQLKKVEEVSKLWDVAMKHLGEKVEVEYMEFPHNKDRQNQHLKSLEMSKTMDYPDDPYDGQETGTF